MRQNYRTFCAFLDNRKAFDVAWRDGALLKGHRAGIPAESWHLVDDFVTNRSAAARAGSYFSETWAVETGVGQGAALSGFLFASIHQWPHSSYQACVARLACDPGCHAPRVQILMYADSDDVVILSESAAGLQRALDAATCMSPVRGAFTSASAPRNQL